MAAFDTTRPVTTATFEGGLLKPFFSVFAAISAWNDARETRKALKALNTHQLDDIGLVSADIDLFIAKYR
ncbi:MAG: DUF1127 domain-containing protein [Pseudomonadota bacterium]